MKLGFVSAILPELGLDELLAFAAAEGFACVEPMCWPQGRADRRYAGVTHVDVGDFGPADAARVRELLARHGVGFSALGYYPNPLTPDRAEAEAVVAHLGKVIRAAALLGVATVNTFIGRDWRLGVDANWPRFLAVWQPLVRLAEDHGVRIGIENCPMLFSEDEWPGGKNLAATPAIWRRMFAAIPSPAFGLNYDPSHLVWQRIDHLRPIAEFAARIAHVHAKDAAIEPDRLDDVGILATPLAWHRPCLPGLGGVRWAEFFAALRRIGYAGPVCIEVEDRDFESSLALRMEALRRSAAFVRPLMAGTASRSAPGAG
jgi:sugar phosphate isomerase/epimerase